MNHSNLDWRSLLDSFRQMNNTSQDLFQGKDTSDGPEYPEARARFSQQAHLAADAAEKALEELEAGDATGAKQYLDRIAHVLGMISAAAQRDPAGQPAATDSEMP